MGRHRIKFPLPSLGRRFAASLGAWLALFAILLQVLMPLPAGASMTADGLFPAVCGLHDFTPDSQPADKPADCQHCPLCQGHLADRLLIPERVVVRAFPAVVEKAERPRSVVSAPGRSSAVPPLPSRGPPSVA